MDLGFHLMFKQETQSEGGLVNRTLVFCESIPPKRMNFTGGSFFIQSTKSTNLPPSCESSASFKSPLTGTVNLIHGVRPRVLDITLQLSETMITRSPTLVPVGPVVKSALCRFRYV